MTQDYDHPKPDAVDVAIYINYCFTNVQLVN